MESPRSRLETAAARDRAGILRSEALAVGMSPAQIDRRVRRRQWLPGPIRGSYVPADSPDRSRATLAVACRRVGGVAWGRSALALWGIGDHPLRPMVAARRPPALLGVDVRWLHDVDRWAIRRDGIPTVGLEVALASTTTPGDTGALHRLVDVAIGEGRTTEERVAEFFLAFAARGRPGSATLRSVVAERRETGAAPLSAWSRSFAEQLVSAGLRWPVLEYRVELEGRLVAQVDLAYPEARLAIELDSRRHHLGHLPFEVDRKRDGDLALAGWRVLRFTWQQWREEWPWVEAVVRSAIGGGPPA